MRLRSIRVLGWIVGVSLLCAPQVWGQETKPISERPGSSGRGLAAEPDSSTVTGIFSRDTQAGAPRLVKFSGVLAEPRTPSGGPVEMTLALYKDELGGEPLWTEIQSVEIDKQGRYTVLLGATQAGGLPVELFPSGEARWLAVEIQGQPQQPRALLVGVPYALKAADAEKLGGKAASDFVSSDKLNEQVRQVIQAQSEVAGQATSTGALQQGQAKANGTFSPQMTPAGPMFPPSSFSGTNSTQIVSVQQNGGGNGLYAQTASSTGNSGVVGVATSTSTSNNQNGVIGFNAGAGSGVAGIATNPSSGVGVYGQSANFAGVFGNSQVTSGFATGVFGLSASPDGAGLFGGNNATTGFAPGISANSQSPSGVGVFGNALATSGFATGVQGLTHSPSGEGVAGFGIATGVLGNASATSGFASGVYGQTASPDGAGAGGNNTALSGFANGVSGQSVSTDGAGVFGNAVANSGFTTGVYGQSISPTGNGVIGINRSNAGAYNSGVLGINNATSGNAYGVNGSIQTTGFGAGVIGLSNSNIGDFNNGVLGINNATTGNAYGVEGFTATTGFGAGVLGSATAATGTPFGVFGRVDSAGAGANGVFGYASAPSGYTIGVSGFVESPSGTAGRFVSHSGSGLLLQGISGSTFNQVFSVDANGNLNISGNLTVSGTKSSTAKVQNGREVALYAVESPENWFEDFGSAELNSGMAWVPLDASFAEATNTATTYHVFLTPNGDSNGLYVARKTAAGFEVREHEGGGSNVSFDYRIVVRRRGYETIRMAEVHGDVNTTESSRQHLTELANSGTLKRTGVIKVPPIATAPAIRPMPPHPSAPEAPRLNVPQPPKVTIPQVPQLKAPQPPQPR